MKTEITNLVNGEKLLFVNELSLTENIVNAIISIKKQTSNLLNDKVRNEIKTQYPIKESFSTLTKRPFAYCESFDLHAKFVN